MAMWSAVARALGGARLARTTVAASALPALPQTLEDAYTVQRCMVEDAARGGGGGGGLVVGWKIGATSEAARQRLHLARPFRAPLFADTVQWAALEQRKPMPGGEPGAGRASLVVDLTRAGGNGVECEFAVRLARDVTAEVARSPELLACAVGEVFPSIEIIGSRVRDAPPLGSGPAATALLVADSGGAGAFIFGRRAAASARPDAPALLRSSAALRAHARLSAADGAVVEERSGSGAEVLGSPLQALAWLAAEVLQAQGMLRAGQVVSTGTCTGVLPVAAGQTLRVDFGALGELELRFTRS